MTAQTSDEPKFLTEPLQPNAFVTCDICGVPALLNVVLANGHDLRYCWHHGRMRGYTPTEYPEHLGESASRQKEEAKSK
jgi:hypothetical protein